MKNLFKLIALLSFVIANSTVKGQNISSQQRPNIIWITCEDMSPHLGSYGEKIAKTPNLDKLAEQSTRYTNVFSTAGVCAPSRSTIVTGMYQTAIGTHHMRVRKSLNAPEAYPVNFLEYNAVVPSYVKAYPEYLRAAGYYCTNNFKTDYQFEAPPTVWDEVGSTATYRNRPDKNQPIFSIFNIETSHEGKVHQLDKLPLLVRPEDVTVPPYYPDNAVIRHDIARFLTNVMRMDEEVGILIQQLKDDGLYDNSYIFFYSDHGDGLPYVKREILDRGLRVPMLVKAPQQKEGRVEARKISFIDLVPTLLSITNLPIPKHLPGKAFLGNKATPEGHRYIFASRDRMDSEYDRVRSVHDGRYQYIRNYMANLSRYQHIRSRLSQPMMKEILRLKEAKQLNLTVMRWFESKPLEELYDVQKDPHQLHDLAKDPAHKAKLNELRKAFNEWSKQYDVYGDTPEMEMVATWWNGKKEAPITEQPQVNLRGNKITLSCKTEGASIGYKTRQADSWKVYSRPFIHQPRDSLYVVAQRIGYKISEVVKQ
jgi:N-sulfoglucosamine sulfohydrolase